MPFKTFYRLGAVLLLPILFSITGSPAYAQATPVGVDTVSREAMSQTIPVIGRLVARQNGVVASRTSGPVAELRVEVGDHVAKDDVLAVLDQSRLLGRYALAKTEIEELDAKRETAEAVRELARKELGRQEKLRKSSAFNESAFDIDAQELAVARSSLKEALARIERGRVALELAAIELEDATIRAPFPGVVTQRYTSEGAWLKVGDPVVKLLNDGNLEIEADVPAERLAGLATGQSVMAQLDDGGRFQAMVRAIVPDENPASRTRPVRFTPQFGELNISLAANQTVTLLLPAGRREEVVSVHKDAVLHRGGRSLVFLVRNGVAKPQPVQLGEAVGSRFQVLEGLAPGDVVVIRGNERLRPGQEVIYPGQSGTAKPEKQS